MKHAVVCLSLVAVLAGCSYRPSRWSGLEHERVSLPQPLPGGDWGFRAERTADATISRWARLGESLQLTVRRSVDRPGPEAFRHDEDVRAQQGNLLSFRSTVLDSGPVNGYPAVLWQKDSVLPGERAVVELHLYIAGNDASYSIRRRWDRGPVAPAELQRWVGFLKEISVCDPRLPDRPCPQ